jgi:hypothetical protein
MANKVHPFILEVASLIATEYDKWVLDKSLVGHYLTHPSGVQLDVESLNVLGMLVNGQRMMVNPAETEVLKTAILLKELKNDEILTFYKQSKSHYAVRKFIVDGHVAFNATPEQLAEEIERRITHETT